jgi:hypothetical protein
LLASALGRSRAIGCGVWVMVISVLLVVDDETATNCLIGE